MTPGLLRITLSLRFCPEHSVNLGTGIHQFCLGKHTPASRKLLKTRVDQHQVIAGGSGPLNLANVVYLTATYGVPLHETLAIARSVHMRLPVVLDTLQGRDHPTVHRMYVFPKYIMEREMELEEYLSRDQGMKTKPPALFT